LLKGLSAKPTGERFNAHPTVKPVELMRRLIRLITPAGGVVLDPFGGSGTTGCAAMAEHVQFVGIERDEYYWRVGDARIRYWRQRAHRGH
jgi:site-specific DNA-methyltransferase (adenine-specific)